MSYTMQKSRKNRFDIFETETGKVLLLDLKKKEANMVCRKLNLGGGFSGFTPDFFLRKMKGC